MTALHQPVAYKEWSAKASFPRDALDATVLNAEAAGVSRERAFWHVQGASVALLICEPIEIVPLASDSQEVVGYVNTENLTGPANSVSHLFAEEARSASYVYN